VRSLTQSRQTLRRFTWIALLAMLGLALAPTVSRALSVLDTHGDAHAGHSAPAHAERHAAAALPGTAPEHADCDEAPAPESDDALAREGAMSEAPPHPPGHEQHGRGAAAEHDHFNHCPLCAIAATAWTVAPAPCTGCAVPLAAQHARAPIADAATPGVAAWSAHQPRGPPASA
jgi:hypothetical protein